VVFHAQGWNPGVNLLKLKTSQLGIELMPQDHRDPERKKSKAKRKSACQPFIVRPKNENRCRSH
jgi:hypothetical protein